MFCFPFPVLFIHGPAHPFFARKWKPSSGSAVNRRLYFKRPTVKMESPCNDPVSALPNTESKSKFCFYLIHFLLRSIKGKFSLWPFETIENDYDKIPCLNITEGRAHTYLGPTHTSFFCFSSNLFSPHFRGKLTPIWANQMMYERPSFCSWMDPVYDIMYVLL